MRRLLLASLAGLALVGIANAADLGVPAVPVATPVIVPPGYFEWFGPYVGVFGGGGFESSTRTDYTYTSSPVRGIAQTTPGFEDVFGPSTTFFVGPPTPAPGPLNVGGGSAVASALAQGFLPSSVGQGGKGFGTGGFVLGFNIQMAQLVFGLEGDWAWMNGVRHGGFTSSIPVPASQNPLTPTSVSSSFTQAAGLNWLGTLRGRVGYAVNRFLIFATGGWAVGGASMSTDVTLTENFNTPGVTCGGNLQTTCTDVFSGRGERFPAGVAVGGGIEWAMTNYLTVKADGLFYDLGTKTYPVPAAAAPVGIGQGLTIHAHQKFEGAVFRIGINYKPEWL